MRRVASFAVATILAFSMRVPARADVPAPLAHLTSYVRSLAQHAPGRVALDVIDLSTGYTAGYNAWMSMPAASTIKIPVMVEVFKQLEAGNFDLDRRVTLRYSDKDWGSGDICEMPAGSSFTVNALLDKMIDISDNTATNMLIRLVGRRNINRTMYGLGLEHTILMSDIRTEGNRIRYTLRSSPSDMASLLERMARYKLIDEWSSRQMIAILADQQHNSLIPRGIPDAMEIAHKTGELRDTLNDVGIVFNEGAPYVIAVMTTDLPSIYDGKRFIRSISHIAYEEMHAFADMRIASGLDTTPGSL